MRTPKPLAPGDEIRIVAPSSPVASEKLEKGVKLLEEAGYKVSLGKNCFSTYHYLAGTDAERAADLNEAFADPNVSAVLCARGGYGAARLLPLLDLDAMAASGKMFLGFSDITTLHLALNNRRLVTYHAPMPLTFSVDREPWVYESFLNALKGENSIPESAPKGTCIVPGKAEGEVVGGCLCLLTDSIGTKDALNCDGKLLLIEDVDENPHRIDAMLTHLLNSGVLERVAGIVVGEMTGTNERHDSTIGPWTWQEIVQDRLAPLNKPLIIDFPFGHRKSGMLTLPLGQKAALDAETGSLSYLY